MKAIDLTGQRFGRLTVIRRCGTSKDGQKVYECRCDCGNIRQIRSGNLRNAHTISCGCLAREKTVQRNRDAAKHGGCGTRLYGIWLDMRQRCSWEDSINWHLYGGRGIKVCDEWQDSFESFRDWSLENGYNEERTIDRIDVNGNYCPENCRWATLDEQNNNKRNCVYVTINGITKTVTEWCRETGVSRTAAYSRIRSGWNPADAVTVTDPNVGKRRASAAKFKPVVVDGKHRFESITAAARHLGVSPHLVSHAVRNGHKTGGHTIEYAEM